MITLVAIVEGEGEVRALRTLVQRVMAEIRPELYIDVPRPILQPRSSLLKEGGVERAVELAARTLNGRPGGILILIDADRDCPVQLRDQLQRRAEAARPDQRIRVVIAKEEYEAWFLAAAESLAGYKGMDPTLADHPDPEQPRDAKGWLGDRRMPRGYAPTADQTSFTERFDLARAARARSFRKMTKEIEWLCSPDGEVTLADEKP